MVMKWDEFPVGIGEMLNGYDIQVPIYAPLQLRHKGFYNARVLPPRRLHLPVLPCNMNGKLLFVLCKGEFIHTVVCKSFLNAFNISACGLQSSTQRVGLCNHKDEERSLTGTWSTFELSLALEKGYIIEAVYSVRNNVIFPMAITILGCSLGCMD